MIMKTREGLSCSYKHCLDNMFVAEEAFRVFMIMNNAGRRYDLNSAVTQDRNSLIDALIKCGLEPTRS
jgi:molybdenum-dependent DNA-binding transcriptional regulator ModE